MGTIIVDFAIKTTTEAEPIAHKVSNVPVKPNYRTNIVGNLISATTDYNVTLNGDWGTPEEVVLVTDINPATRTITINSVDELLSLNSLNENWNALFSNGQGTTYSDFAEANGGKGTDYYYKWDWTIKLNADLDLNNITLDAPINVSGFGCFDGKNHTIKNVKIETATDVDTAAGLFTASKYAKMQNVKLDNVHVTGSLVGDSTAGILVSDCNSGINNITIANSSVYGGKYTGGVVGYGYTDVTNCSLTNVTVKGGYKLGGVIGYICTSNGEGDVTGCTLTGCTVSGTDGQYAGGKSEYIMGKVVGNYNCNGTCSDNTVSSMTTTAINIIGKIEAGKNVTIENNVMGVSSWDELKTSIVNGDIIELDNDITVDEWIMFSETKTIGTGQIITVPMDGLTIDGNGHTLTVNSIESASNGDLLFDGASNLNIHDLTIKYADGLRGGGISLKTGVISNVNFIGGGYGIYPGSGEIMVEECTFATNADALYFEQERDNLTVTGCTFNQPADKNVILLRGDVQFTNNIINSGRTVNIVSGSPVVTGNNFNNVRLKVYAAATATVSGNTINNLVFETITYSSTFIDNTLSPEAQAALAAATKN